MARDLSVETFASPQALADALAARVAEELTAAVKARGRATLAVSGGTTPVRFFEALSRIELRWDRVKITLVDERYVDHRSERSNERLVSQHLLAHGPRKGFHSLCWGDRTRDRRLGSLADEARKADGGIRPLRQPFDVVILGMGNDGHTASFFPDAGNLDALLDPKQERQVMAVEAPSAGEPRLTLTLPVIARARFLALHIEGEAKRATLDRALSDEGRALPIRIVLDHAETTPHIFWAP